MSATEGPGGIGHLRCSDSDRELVADVLGRAFSEGRITFDEHDERLTRAYGARTFSELDALTTDLIAPTQTPPAMSASSHIPERRFNTTPAIGPVLRDSTTILTTLKPGYPLHVPQETSLVVILGDAKIDLVNATFDSNLVRINLNVLMGDVKIRVPEGIHIVSALSNIMSDFKASNLPTGPSSVTVELHGTMVMGNVKVLGPGGRTAKYERFVR
ncbi:DUF1707 SHOCT-like domain-containing protein [Tessaracoccus sp.]